MVWTRRFIRTAFIFLVMMTMLADQSNADIQTIWIPVGGAEVNNRVYRLQSDGRRLYGATERGLEVSDDNGATWTWRTTEFERGVSAFTVHGNTIYVGSYRDVGMLRSDDRGETWKPINNGLRLFEYADGGTYYGWIKQILVTRSGAVIAVMRGPIYISYDRGETWLDVTLEWIVPAEGALDDYLSYNDAQLLEFDGYLWAALKYTIVRSPDNGRTWEFVLPQHGSLRFPTAWVVHNNRIYVAAEYHEGDEGETAYFARYENALSHPLVQGLPPHPRDHRSASQWAYIDALVSHDNRIFAAIRRRGVYVFNERSETWSYVGLNGAKVDSLVSHRSDLYAATDEGIYRAAFPRLQPYNKAAVTWGAIKQKQ